MGYRNSGYRSSEVNWSYWKTLAWGGVATTWTMLGLSAMGFTNRPAGTPAPARANDSDPDLTADLSSESVDSADSLGASRPVSSPQAVSSLPSVSMPAVDYSRPSTPSSSPSPSNSPSSRQPQASQPAAAPSLPAPSSQTIVVNPVASNPVDPELTSPLPGPPRSSGAAATPTSGTTQSRTATG
ncbi:hypothetical protein XM38_034350 [Halomicronema hongdechloris C2206]|uniref:Uncharacterized protein n=1 Tax=Halomicronema hongdechloris C2206 TaxID=1641165 RepID=A0A1Z3HQA4_9CYAN|nr:hypothetical protein [Halomicronema hongdechloris]ASC72478.1 hypothetical protein XM38_034350 [Halomicronema hongdechloris C2206]